MPKLVGARIEQQNRRQRTDGLFFDEPAQGIEDCSSRIAPGYHLQEPLLAGQQHLGLLSVGNIRRAAYELQQIPGCIQNRMADGVRVFDRAVRKKDPHFHVVIRLLTDCSIGRLSPLGSIVRMHALHPFFPGRKALFRIKAIYAVPFLGEM